jgi:hypothetical protein
MTALVARRALLRVSVAAVLANSTWFSATAVVPALSPDWQLTAAGAAWLAIAVQAGFIAGSVTSAMLKLPDRLEQRRLMAASAVAAAAFNAERLAAGGLAEALPSRFLVGVAIAGVYAPGVRLVATHFDGRRGLAAGIVVGALTFGSSMPHLVRGLADIPWQATIAATSVLALGAVPAILPVRAARVVTAAPPLDLGAAWRALRERPLRLTTGSYLGHMWGCMREPAGLRRPFRGARDRTVRLGRGRDRRLGAVLRGGDRAGRSGVRRARR